MRYFDPSRRRPGLPEHVSALVERVAPEGITMTLVNTDPAQAREVLVQAGGFGEHQFTEVRLDSVPDAKPKAIDGKHFRVRLGPATRARLHLGMKRFAHMPSYAFPSFEKR